MKKKHGEIALTAGLGAIGLLLFSLWLKTVIGNRSLTAILFAALSLVLFLIICFRLVNSLWENLKKCIRKPCAYDGPLMQSRDTVELKEKIADCFKIFVAMWIFCFAIVALVYLLGVFFKDNTFSQMSVNIRYRWLNLDSKHYLGIAENWYTNDGEAAERLRLVFLPGYPVLVGLFGKLIKDYFAVGMMVSAICLGGAADFLYLLVRNDGGSRKTAITSVIFLCLVPGSFFFAAPMTESLFLFCTLGSIYLMRKRLWLFSSIFGFYAAFTRSVGFLLIVPFVIELFMSFHREYSSLKRHYAYFDTGLREKDNLLFKYGARLLLCIIIAGGMGAYLLVNLNVTGNMFTFLDYQKENWSQEISYFFNTVGYMVDFFASYIIKGETNLAFSIWGMGLLSIFANLAVLIWGAKKIRPSYVAYSLCYFAVSMGATWLLSATRYCAAMFTLPLCLGLMAEKKSVKLPLILGLGVINFAYIIMFVLYWQVW